MTARKDEMFGDDHNVVVVVVVVVVEEIDNETVC